MLLLIYLITLRVSHSLLSSPKYNVIDLAILTKSEFLSMPPQNRQNSSVASNFTTHAFYYVSKGRLLLPETYHS